MTAYDDVIYECEVEAIRKGCQPQHSEEVVRAILLVVSRTLEAWADTPEFDGPRNPATDCSPKEFKYLLHGSPIMPNRRNLDDL